MRKNLFLLQCEYFMTRHKTEMMDRAEGCAGEATLLSYTHYFQSIVIAAWSSGTGGAGVLGNAFPASFYRYCGLVQRYGRRRGPRYGNAFSRQFLSLLRPGPAVQAAPGS
jgi:hypothetical protein